MTDVNASAGRLLVAGRQGAQEVQAPAGRSMAVINFPTQSMESSQARTLVSYNGQVGIEVYQARTMVAAKGRIANPKLKSWTYTLDGHDYFVLKLGDKKTLVFDFLSGQWSWFASDPNQWWRANTGFNWRSAGAIPQNYGSNVIVGDDTHGILWVLDPMAGVDQHPIAGQPDLPFTRVATGQMAIRGRNFEPIYSVWLTASLGQPALTVNSVTLEYSDDQGHTYVVADEPMTAVSGDYAQEFKWMSMGQVRAPGRLFRITDNGSFARIDSLSINE